MPSPSAEIGEYTSARYNRCERFLSAMYRVELVAKLL